MRCVKAEQSMHDLLALLSHVAAFLILIASQEDWASAAALIWLLGPSFYHGVVVAPAAVTPLPLEVTVGWLVVADEGHESSVLHCSCRLIT